MYSSASCVTPNSGSITRLAIRSSRNDRNARHRLRPASTGCRKGAGPPAPPAVPKFPYWPACSRSESAAWLGSPAATRAEGLRLLPNEKVRQVERLRPVHRPRRSRQVRVRPLLHNLRLQPQRLQIRGVEHQRRQIEARPHPRAHPRLAVNRHPAPHQVLDVPVDRPR